MAAMDRLRHRQLRLLTAPQHSPIQSIPKQPTPNHQIPHQTPAKPQAVIIAPPPFTPLVKPCLRRLASGHLFAMWQRRSPASKLPMAHRAKAGLRGVNALNSALIGMIAFKRQIGNNGGLPMWFGQAADAGIVAQFAFRTITSNNELTG